MEREDLLAALKAVKANGEHDASLFIGYTKMTGEDLEALGQLVGVLPSEPAGLPEAADDAGALAVALAELEVLEGQAEGLAVKIEQLEADLLAEREKTVRMATDWADVKEEAEEAKALLAEALELAEKFKGEADEAPAPKPAAKPRPAIQAADDDLMDPRWRLGPEIEPPEGTIINPDNGYPARVQVTEGGEVTLGGNERFKMNRGTIYRGEKAWELWDAHNDRVQALAF